MSDCTDCRDSRFCERYGCMQADDRTAERYRRMAEIARETNQRIDELERLFGRFGK